MEIDLIAKNKLGFINVEYKKHSSDSLDLLTSEKCNSMEISWVLNILMKKISESVVYAPTAYEIWQELHENLHSRMGLSYLKYKIN